MEFKPIKLVPNKSDYITFLKTTAEANGKTFDPSEVNLQELNERRITFLQTIGIIDEQSVVDT